MNYLGAILRMITSFAMREMPNEGRWPNTANPVVLWPSEEGSDVRRHIDSGVGDGCMLRRNILCDPQALDVRSGVCAGRRQLERRRS
jgi:hypothetical protein